MLKLMHNVHQFQTEPFEKMRPIFEQLSKGQAPEILFITCIDSRVIPSLLTQSKPGELLIHRNAGNIVPAYPNMSSEAATIEYALKVLHVKDIIICGHSDCGAVKGLLTPKIKNDLPSVASWVEHSHAVLKEIEMETDKDDFSIKVRAAIKKNVLAQMGHLKTYPLVAEKLASQQLTLHGWVYHFETGEVLIYEPKQDRFLTLENVLQLSLEERRSRIVQTIAMNYLEQFTHPQTASAYRSLMHLFTQITEDLTAIWELIKEQVSQSLWSELGDLYTDPMDSEFSAMVALGAHTKLDSFQYFQENIENSPGYHQYRSQIIHHTLFGKSTSQLKLAVVHQKHCSRGLGK